MPIKERTYTVSSYRVVCDKCGYDTAEYKLMSLADQKAKQYGWVEIEPGVYLCEDCYAEKQAES